MAVWGRRQHSKRRSPLRSAHETSAPMSRFESANGPQGPICAAENASPSVVVAGQNGATDAEGPPLAKAGADIELGANGQPPPHVALILMSNLVTSR